VRESLLLFPLDEAARGTLLELTAQSPAPSTPEAPAPAAPRQDRYAVGAEIGRGGLGRVAQARDLVLNREVAVKEMIRGAEDSRLLRRFLREGEIAGRLSHPHIVPVYDVGVRDEGQGPGGAMRKVPFFVMTRIVGRDLSEILRAVDRGAWDDDDRPAPAGENGGPEAPAHHPIGNPAREPRKEFSRPRLLQVFQDICLAAGYAHDHGVIHRDLKPANVMVGNYGEVYVVDWGLAKVKGQADDAGATVAVPGRASPEQAGAGGEGRGAQAECAPCPVPHAPTSQPALTLEGDVLGTPAYMPPEQADGRVAEMDERSDIYSLGAILYEILTLRPPFEGSTGLNVIAKVLSGDLTPPSLRVSEVRRAKEEGGGGAPRRPQQTPGSPDVAPADAPDPETRRPAKRDPEGPGYPEPIPPELEAIVLKAMARERKDRHASALDLHAEIQGYLEGERQREYNRERALAKVAEGRILFERMKKLRADVDALEEERVLRGRGLKAWWPVEKKRDVWAMQDRVEELGDEIARHFGRASTAFHEALGFERRNREARAALTELYWDRALQEEEAGNRSQRIYFEGLAREYNDGAYDEILEGDGTLSVSTRSYPCRCLLDGRWVAPEELAGSGGGPGHAPGEGGDPIPEFHLPGYWQAVARRGLFGCHPFSGRALDGRPDAEGSLELEPAGPVRLKVHGRACRPLPLAGADVWLFRLEERDKVVVPGMPALPEAPGGASRPEASGASAPCRGGSDRGGPAGNPAESPGGPRKPEGGAPMSPGIPPKDVLDRLYDPGSPYRPTAGLYLGKTPVPAFRIPMGSYLLIVAHSSRGERSAGSGEEGADGLAADRSPFAGDDRFAPVRVPLCIGRNATESADVTLYRESEIPREFLLVPSGKFVWQGDPGNPYSAEKEVFEQDDFCLARFPITCGEYLAFLNDLAGDTGAKRPPGDTGWPEAGGGLDEALRRAPRQTVEHGCYWPCVPGPAGEGADRPAAQKAPAAGGRFVIPTGEWFSKAPEEWRARASRLEGCAAWWEEDWPIVGVSWLDLMAYASWARARTGHLLTLPAEPMWEKAARGPDGRTFPWGGHLDPIFCNSNLSLEGGMQPCAVDSFPFDESVYGIRGLGGNSRDLCLNDSGPGFSGRRMSRGGSWAVPEIHARSSRRTGGIGSGVYYGEGGRLCLVLRIG
jgi:serine/threonine protein kinase/formylglycine-generating enzyme required for sulfatase activity